MKKIFLFLLLLSSVISHAQRQRYVNGKVVVLNALKDTVKIGTGLKNYLTESLQDSLSVDISTNASDSNNLIPTMKLVKQMLSDYKPSGGPLLTLSPSSLSGFSTNAGNPSPTKAFSVSYSDLTDTQIKVDVTGDYEISSNAGVSYASTISFTSPFPPAPINLLARIKATALVGQQDGNIYARSIGATTRTTTLSGTVTTPSTEPDTIAINITAGPGNPNKDVTGNWNNILWSQTSTGSLIRLKDGTASTVGIILPTFANVSNNYSGGDACPSTTSGFPKNVFNYAPFTDGSNLVFTLTGLDNSSQYKLVAVGYRVTQNLTNTISVAGYTSSSMNLQNCNGSMEINGITPSSGNIVCTISSSGQYRYINAIYLIKIPSL